MKIWIVDDDVDFSHFLKQTLSYQLKTDYHLTVEVKLIYWFQSYLTELNSAKKNKESLPFFIFFNPWMQDQDHFFHYLEEIKMKEDLPTRFVLTTSKAYGIVEDLLKQNKINNFLYLQKKHLKDDLDKILKLDQIKNEFLELKAKKNKIPIKGFSKNRAFKNCQSLAKNIQDIFYDQEDKLALIKNYQALSNEIKILELDQKSIWIKLEKLLQHPEKIGQLKLKRITQDLLIWFKEMEFIDE